jgi:glycosyltransferase involved in cell wall biosynthesis
MHFFIVTPSYNQAQFIKQTIDSVLGQKGDFSIEYWVFDAQSKDDTVAVLKKYGKKVNWVSEPDKGQSDAINKGIKRMLDSKINLDNTVFAYINSDDYYLPGAFSQVERKFIDHPDAQWLTGDCLVVDEKNKSVHSLIYWYRKILQTFFQPWFLYILNPIAQPATFIRATAVKKTGFFSINHGLVMDYEYWHKLLKQFSAPLILSETLAAFRIHTLSKGGQQFKKQFADQYAVAKRYNANPILLLFHRIHNFFIIAIYSLIK